MGGVGGGGVGDYEEDGSGWVGWRCSQPQGYEELVRTHVLTAVRMDNRYWPLKREASV